MPTHVPTTVQQVIKPGPNTGTVTSPSPNIYIPTPSSNTIHQSNSQVHPGSRVQNPVCFSNVSKNTDVKLQIEVVHEGHKPQCTICSAHFSRKTDLKQHIETVHQGKRPNALLVIPILAKTQT